MCEMESMVPLQAEKEKGLTEKAEDVAEKVQHTHTHAHTHKLMMICTILNGGGHVHPNMLPQLS